MREIQQCHQLPGLTVHMSAADAYASTFRSPFHAVPDAVARLHRERLLAQNPLAGKTARVS